MKRYNWILISLVSFAILFLSAFIILKNNHSDIFNKGDQVIGNPLEAEAVNSMFGVIENSYRLSNLQYSYNTEDIYGNKKDIIDLIDKGSKLVLRYSELNCDVCVDSALSYFTKFAQKIGDKNVVLLVEYKSDDYLAQLVRLNHINLPNLYRIVSSGKTAENSITKDAPFLFLLDSSRQMKEVFYPLKEMPSLSEMYYNTMYEKYFKK